MNTNEALVGERGRVRGQSLGRGGEGHVSWRELKSWKEEEEEEAAEKSEVVTGPLGKFELF